MIQDVTQWFRTVFGTPSAEQLALRELEDAKRRLLDAQSSKEYATAMCDFYEAKIDRLGSYLGGFGGPK